MNGIERSIESGNPQRNAAAEPLAARARAALVARFSPVEWILLAAIVVLPTAFIWHFASLSHFFWDDIANIYWAHNTPPLLSYLFGATYGDHLSPAHRLAYLVLDRVAPMNFELALAFLWACQAASAVLLQRILTLLFGRAWWTFALALVWAISPVYLSGFTWFAGGLHSVPAITATVASIHAYLCWRATARRTWLAWSLVAMGIGLAFYVKALLIPLYLILMRTLLLEPGARLRDSLRSVRDEWRVWLAYAAMCTGFVLAYLVGDYSQYYQSETGASLGDFLRYLRIFWVEGFSPMLLGIRVPLHGQGEWHRIVIVVAQLVLIGLIAWSILRRRAAWRAWAFLLVTLAANGLLLVPRVSQWGAENVAYTMRYYTEPALLVPLAVAFAFATPRLPGRVAAVEPTNTPHTPQEDAPRERPRFTASDVFRLPTARAGALAVLALAAYVVATWGTANSLTGPATPDPEVRSGRIARAYLDNLRGDLASARGGGVQPTLLDGDVPHAVVTQLNNLEPVALRAGVRFSLLSTVVPLFDDEVKFNQPGHMFIVRSDGHLERTRFVSVAGGSPAELRGGGRFRPEEARIEGGQDEVCGVSEGIGALEWKPRPRLRGHDWWLRIRYQSDPIEPIWLQTDTGDGSIYQGFKLPSMGAPGTVLVDLSEAKDGVPTVAGVRLGIPVFGRLCLRSLQIGHFDPPAPEWASDVLR
jgi:hypothetical protein